MKHILEVNMTFKKSTKRTHVYEAPEKYVSQVYVQRTGLPEPAPEKIILRIEVPE